MSIWHPSSHLYWCFQSHINKIYIYIYFWRRLKHKNRGRIRGLSTCFRFLLQQLLADLSSFHLFSSPFSFNQVGIYQDLYLCIYSLLVNLSSVLCIKMDFVRLSSLLIVFNFIVSVGGLNFLLGWSAMDPMIYTWIW